MSVYQFRCNQEMYDKLDFMRGKMDYSNNDIFEKAIDHYYHRVTDSPTNEFMRNRSRRVRAGVYGRGSVSHYIRFVGSEKTGKQIDELRDILICGQSLIIEKALNNFYIWVNQQEVEEYEFIPWNRKASSTDRVAAMEYKLNSLNNSDMSQQFGFRYDDRTYARMNIIANHYGVSFAEVIRMAINRVYNFHEEGGRLGNRSAINSERGETYRRSNVHMSKYMAECLEIVVKGNTCTKSDAIYFGIQLLFEEMD